MRRPALVVLLALAAPATASAEEVTVSMPARVFLPSQVTAVVGDTVTWSNSSNENHDVSAENGGPFQSGGVAAGGRFSYLADTPGAYPYVCVIHRSQMQGRLDVVPIALAGPPAPITSGETALLTGRAPVGTGQVAIEEIAADGSSRGLETLSPDAAGRFQTTVKPERTTAYRVVGPAGASPPLTVPVVDRVRILVTAQRGRHRVTLRVRTDPARPGDTVARELYSRERFAWRQVKHGTLDARGRVELTVPRRVRRLARVVIQREGLTIGRSAPLMTWRAGRVGAKPPAHAAPEHGGH